MGNVPTRVCCSVLTGLARDPRRSAGSLVFFEGLLLCSGQLYQRSAGRESQSKQTWHDEETLPGERVSLTIRSPKENNRTTLKLVGSLTRGSTLQTVRAAVRQVLHTNQVDEILST